MREYLSLPRALALVDSHVGSHVKHTRWFAVDSMSRHVVAAMEA